MVANPSQLRVELDVDGEGVVRVLTMNADRVTLSADELGHLLTGLVKAICGTDDGEETINVSLS